jgi:hypothetical protein
MKGARGGEGAAMSAFILLVAITLAGVTLSFASLSSTWWRVFTRTGRGRIAPRRFRAGPLRFNAME